MVGACFAVDTIAREGSFQGGDGMRAVVGVGVEFARVGGLWKLILGSIFQETMGGVVQREDVHTSVHKQTHQPHFFSCHTSSIKLSIPIYLPIQGWSI